MKRLSFWAKQHIWQARFLLVLLQTLLVSCAFLIGSICTDWILIPSAIFKYLGLLLGLLGFIFYPLKNTKLKLWQHSYVRQKCFDGTLILSGFLLFFSAGKDFISQENSKSPTTTEWRPELMVHKTAVNVSPKKWRKQQRKTRRFERKQLRKKLKKVIKQARKEKTAGEKAFLLILTLFAAYLCSYGILILACNLACSGLEVLAYLVVIGGASLMIWGFIAAMRGIFGKKKKAIQLSDPS